MSYKKKITVNFEISESGEILDTWIKNQQYFDYSFVEKLEEAIRGVATERHCSLDRTPNCCCEHRNYEFGCLYCPHYDYFIKQGGENG